tara:strand:- start:342 stop:1415 length:1074 start_codon:yes stop_codon:yes gene_type:complete
MQVIKLEYIWIDGVTPTPSLRSKTKVVRLTDESYQSLMEEMQTGVSIHEKLPVWGFDGSSTEQASGEKSDCVLRPVFTTADPTRQRGLLVLCEVLNTDMTPHESNTRSKVMSSLAAMDQSLQPRVGFEQEYTLIETETNRPLGWPKNSSSYPAPQGQYYCASGANNVAGRQVAEAHLDICLAAGLSIEGVNAEVMLGQWEYQVGGIGVDALTACDHLWVARYLMDRLAEQNDLYASLDPKPVSGDWNGSGMHTNFSTSLTRAEEGGLDAIKIACSHLEENAESHLEVYGDGIDRRLTGLHETCSYKEFRYGVSDRGASVRIPWQVDRLGHGYFEDRRPNSNADPYLVLNALVNTVCM